MARNGRGEKQCARCREWVAEDEFSPSKRSKCDGLQAYCKICNTVRRYGLTRIDVAAHLAAQGNRCPICNRTLLAIQDFEVDHDHACCPAASTTCGKCTRGIICKWCNRGVLPTLENDALVKNGLKYLGKA